MTKENYYNFEKEIYSILNSTFNYLEEKHFQEYVLLLARVEKFNNKYHTESAWDYEIDNTRNKFLVTYLNHLYSSIKNEIDYSTEEKEMLLNIQILMKMKILIILIIMIKMNMT